MELITVEDVYSGKWFVAHVHDSYGLGDNWIPCSQHIENEKKYQKEIINYLLWENKLQNLIDTPNLPKEEEQRLLHIFYKIHKDREEFKDNPKRMKAELIYRDHYITGKSLYNAKITIENFLKTLEERKVN